MTNCFKLWSDRQHSTKIFNRNRVEGRLGEHCKMESRRFSFLFIIGHRHFRRYLRNKSELLCFLMRKMSFNCMSEASA
jgi:hypothetical protein